jgi:hypothetical protein
VLKLTRNSDTAAGATTGPSMQAGTEPAGTGTAPRGGGRPVPRWIDRHRGGAAIR